MNREVVGGGGAAIYPLIGDVTSTPGNSSVVVTGLQTTPIATPFKVGGEYLEYDVNTNTWRPLLRATIQVNNLTVSDDYIIAINNTGFAEVNGSLVG